jgi:hypothetical protein
LHGGVRFLNVNIHSKFLDPFFHFLFSHWKLQLPSLSTANVSLDVPHKLFSRKPRFHEGDSVHLPKMSEKLYVTYNEASSHPPASAV